MSFVATRNKGFAMTFENGFGISVQWGTENYCEKKSFNTDIDPMEHDRWESLSAEIAIYKDQKFIDIGDDTVIGWLSPDEVAKIIEGVASAESSEEIINGLKTLKI
tara:strand:+ start:178 stop:495 length:318 start_codon:yes stop_codon:yes gene_type:complete